MMCPKLLLGAALLASTCLLNSIANAADVYWDVNGSAAGSGVVNGSTVSWNTDLLWNSASDGTGVTAAWVGGNTAVFAAGTDATGTYTINVSGTQQLSGLSFEEGTFTLNGGTLSFAGVSGGLAQIGVDSGRTATINSVLAGDEDLTITKSGQGTVVFGASSTNLSSGTTLDIQQGAVHVANPNALSGVAVSLGNAGGNDAGFFGTTGGTTIANNITVVADSAGTLTLGGVNTTGTLIMSGNVAINSDVTLSAASGGTVNFSGSLSDMGTQRTVTKAGAGTVILSGSNTFGTGSTIEISSGTLVAASSSALGDGSAGVYIGTGSAGSAKLQVGTGVTIQNDIVYNGTWNVAGQGPITGPSSGSATIAGDIYLVGGTSAGGLFDGGTGLHITGAIIDLFGAPVSLRTGTLFLDNAVGNVYSTFLISAGTLNLGVDDAMVTDATLHMNLAGTGTFNTQGFDQTLGEIRFSGTSNVTATINTGTGLLTVNGNITSTSTTGQHVINGNLSLGGQVRTITNGAANLTINAVISEGGIIKAGTGTLILTGANTYTGATTINNGILRISAEENLGAGPAAFDAAHLTINGGTLEAAASATIDDANRGITIGNGTAGTGTFDVNAGQVLTVNNVITGTGQLIKADAGVLTLGAANTFSGGVVVNGGVLRLDHANAIAGGVGATGGTVGITLSGGVLGLGSTDFQRGLGTGADQIQIIGSGGFAAFGADRTVNFGGAGAGITWDSGGFLTGGGTLILGDSTATHTLIIANSINLNTTTAARAIQVLDGSAGVDGHLAGGLTDSGTFGFVKTGAGTLRVGGSYAGAWTLQGGSVLFDATPTGPIILDGGVYASNNTVEGGAFTRPLGSVGTTVRWTANGGGFAAQGGPLTVTIGTSPLIWGSTTDFLTGAGPLIFNSTSADSVLTWTNDINLNNTATTSVVRTIRVDDNPFSTDDYAVMTGVLSTSSGSVNLTKTGLGILELRAANTYAGATIVNAGTLRLGVGGALPSGTALTVSGDVAGNIATFDLGNATQTVASLTLGGSTATNGAAIIGTGTLTLGGNVTYNNTGNNLGATISANLDLGGVARTFTIGDSTGAADDVLISGLISNGGISKAGAGRLHLSNDNNSFAGPITISGGTLSVTSVANVGSNSALGGPTTVANGTITMSGGRLRYAGTDLAGHTTDRAFTFTTTSVIEASGVGALTLTGTLTATDGSVTLDGTGVGNLNNTTVWTAGPGDDFNKNGTGTWNLNGATSAPDDWLINEGTLNAKATNSLNATDDVVIDGTGTEGSVVVNLEAADVFSGDDFFIRNGGRVNVLVDNAFSGTDVDQLLIGDTASIGAAGAWLNLAANISLGTNGLVLGNNGGQTGKITGTGVITSTGTFSLRNGTIGTGVTLAGAGAITKVGNGVVTFSGTRTGTGATHIQEGELILDYSVNDATKLGGAVLNLGATSPNVSGGGGKLTLNGKDNSATTDGPVSTTILAGATEVSLNAGTNGSITLNLGALTRTVVGGTVAFTYDTSNATVNTGALNAFLGYATLTTGGVTRFAATDGSGNIVQALTTAESDIDTWVGADNIISTGTFTGQAGTRATVISSLTFDAAVANTISTLTNRRLTISSGGILVNSTVGANNTVISGGQIVGSSTAPLGELIIHQHNTAGTLEIASNIFNSAGMTKSGAGELILSGYNTFAASSLFVLNEGKVTLRGGNAIGDTTVVHMKQGTTLAIADGVTETIGRLGIDGTSVSHGTIALGSGSRLNINQGASASFSGVFTGGADAVITKTGNGNLQLFGSSTGFTGRVEVNGGLFYLSGNAGRLNGVTSFTLNKGSSFMLDNNDDNSPNDRISNTAAITLNSVDGTFSGQTRPYGLVLRTDNNADETESIGVLTFASGSSYATLEGTATGTNVSVANLIASNFVRNVGTTIDVRGINLGGTASSRGQLKIADGANEAAFLASGNLVGGTGTVGTGAKNVKIVPWAIGENLSAALTDTNMGNTFLTYVDNRGFVALDLATEYRTFAAGGTAQDNVREVLTVDSTGIAGQTINSLVVHDNTTAAGTLALTGTGGGQALTVTSGGFLFTLNPAATGAHTINVGGFDDGIKAGPNNEYLFFVVNPSSVAATPTLTVNVSSPLNSTAASLTKAGRGTLVLSGTNTYGGGTYLNEGVLQISNLANLGTGALNFAGGTLQLSAGFAEDLSTRAMTLTSAGGFIDNNGVNTVWANGLDMVGTGPFAKTGSGMMTIQGDSSYTGTFVAGHGAGVTAASIGVSQGVLLNGATNQAISGNLQIGSTVLPASGVAGVALGADEQIVDTATISFNGSSTSSRWAYFKLLGHTETVAGISDTTATGIIENREGAAVTSSGTLILNSDQNFSFNGRIRDNSSATADPFALSLVKMGSGTQILSGTEIRYTGGTTVSGGVLYLLNTTRFSSGIVNDATVVFDYTNATALTLTRDISGSGKYIKRGTGTVEWNGNNTFSGSLAVEEGVLSFGSSLGNNSVGNTISIHDGATLRSTGTDVTLGVNQDIDLGGSATSIDVAGSSGNHLTIEGTISGGAHTAFQKTGAGRLILSGANSFAGATNVLAGILDVRHASAITSSSHVTVANGASLAFNASASGPAIDFSFTGTGNVLTLGTTGGSATLGFGINGATNDKLILGAGQTLAIGGTNVITDIYINGIPTLSSYNLIQSAGAMTFSQFTLGTIFNAGSFTYALDTSGTNNLVLNVTAVTAPPVAYWKGDLSGTGTGVWSAYQIGANSTNWDTDATSGIDTGVVPGANTDVFFAANNANTFTTTLGSDITVRGVTFMAGSGTGGSNTSVGGPHTLTLGAGGITLQAGSGSISISAPIAMATTQTWMVTDAAATLTASGGLSGETDFTKDGAGTVILSGDSFYTGATNIIAGTLQIGAGGTTGTLGAGNVTNNGTLIFNRAGTYVVNQIISGSGSVIKRGTGSVTLNTAHSYGGTTAIEQGTILLGANNVLPTTTAVTLGAGSTVGTLDLGTSSQSIAGLAAASNSASANVVNIASGQTLTVNGNLTVSNPTDAANTILNFTGGGSLVVSGAAANIRIAESAGTNVASKATLDLSGLSNFTANLGTGSLVVGAVGDNDGTMPSVMRLATNNSITAATVTVGGSSSGNTQSFILGGGTNDIRANTLNIGTGGRDGGIISFAGPTGTFTLQTAAGGRTNINMGTGSASTGYALSTTLALAGHEAHLLVNNMVIGNQPRNGNATHTVTFDQGTFDMNSLSMSTRTTTGGTNSANKTITTNFEVGGGRVDIRNGISQMSQVTVTNASYNGAVSNSTFTVTGGEVYVGATSGRSVTMASATANHTATAIFDLVGGLISFSGDIVKGGGASTTSAVINLDGGTLDMNTRSIGSSTNAVTFNARTGTLRNLGELNGGAALTKTSDGVLNVEGINAYTGSTNITDGTFNMINASLTGNGAVVVNKAAPLASTAVLSGTGSISGSVTLGSTTPGESGILRPGTNVGAGHGTLSIDGNLVVNSGSQIQMSLGSATLVSSGLQAALANGTAVNALDYLNQNNGEVAVWNVAPQDSGDHDYINITGALSMPTVGDRASGTYGDGSIVVSLGADFDGSYGSVYNLLDWVANGNIAGSFDVGTLTMYDASGNVIAGDLDLPTLGAGQYWDVSAFSQYGVLVVVPEPGRAVLLLLGLGSLILRRRRKGC